MFELIRTCRPRQWTKNLLVFAAPLFAFRFDIHTWLAASGALVAFCLISCATYLLNDSLDVASDRAHPTKRYRPIAAGRVSVPAALSTALVLAVASLSFSAWITPALAWVVLFYGIIQVGYSLQLKRMPLLDLFCIASGFLLRAIAGAVAAKLPPSPWFLLSVGLLVALMVGASLAQRERDGGWISYGASVWVMLRVCMLGTLISVLFMGLLYNVFDKGLADQMKEITLEQMEQMLENFDVPADQIEEQLEAIEARDFTQTPRALATSWMISVVFGLLLALIASAFTKKSEPLFADESTITHE